jgi:glycosyltransferase involved in cell wall biosynthesis
MTRVLLSTVRLLEFLEGAGHFWVYMQYAHALRRLGCEVRLLDSSIWDDVAPAAARVRELRDRMALYGLEDSLVVTGNGGVSEAELAERIGDVDLLLNFNYHLGSQAVGAARTSALVDIDPGLLQFWVSRGFISPAPHDVYFTTGETVGDASSPIPDCGIDWVRIRPPVALDLWPYMYERDANVFTTVSSWWGERDYVGDADDFYDNTKRAAFAEFADLPRRTEQPLELALYLADSDVADRDSLEARGWRVRHSREVAGTPARYQEYVQRSRGEFSWAKASCMRFQNAWISDRSLCYLASGKPVVVQHTGPSSYLPDGDGVFRVRTPAEAARAFQAINSDYEEQCRRARSVAEEHFDADVIVKEILERAL